MHLAPGASLSSCSGRAYGDDWVATALAIASVSVTIASVSVTMLLAPVAVGFAWCARILPQCCQCASVRAVAALQLVASIGVLAILVQLVEPGHPGQWWQVGEAQGPGAGAQGPLAMHMGDTAVRCAGSGELSSRSWFADLLETQDTFTGRKSDFENYGQFLESLTRKLRPISTVKENICTCKK